MIDLHVHYPMHLLGGVEDPRDIPRGMFKLLGREENRLRAAVLNVAARLLNFRHWDSGWRATLPQLEAGRVSVACSVLYRPFSEMDLDEPYAAPPESAYFGKLIELLEATERSVGDRTVVKQRSDLDKDGLKFVHCVEGGFHLGATPDEVDANVRELARRGVLYITLAHLFWRRVATNAPALPFLPDAIYNALFPQKGGLSELGRAAVKACRDTGVIVDLSHMREESIKETLELLGPDVPVIASHSAYRFGGQTYNLSDATIAQITARKGVIGLIFAQHQLNDGLRRTSTKTLADSLAVLDRHIEAIGPDHVAIGSDLDGFIKPTTGGVETAADLATFADALRARHPATAEGILTGNALRILEHRFR